MIISNKAEQSFVIKKKNLLLSIREIYSIRNKEIKIKITMKEGRP